MAQEFERRAKCIVILGENGCGKTTIAKKIIDIELKKGGKSLVVVPDYVEWSDTDYIEVDKPLNYSGIRKTVFIPSIYRNNELKMSGTITNIMKNFRNGQLAFEDCRSYFGFSTEMDLRKLFIRRRQMMVDIIAMAHGFTEVPPAFFTYATEIILFKTKDNITRRKNCLHNFDAVKEVYERVNIKAEENPHYYEIIKM